uniref:Calmodulin-lysine N-methyltransferase n=1 Tax=Ascaris lumbricoides TaxID=6252 RepID=A0A0M3I3L4_ASCLU
MQKQSTTNPHKQQVDEGGQQSHNEVTKELIQLRPHRDDSAVVTPPSSARRRWMLLTNKVMKTKPKESEREDSSGFKSFGFFGLAAFGERSPSGSWYQLISPTKDVHLELHFLSADGTTLKDLVGYDNTGNVRLWPAEECLAQYLLLNDAVCRGKRVLELGAGMTGLAGLMALTSGAKSVCLTDGNERSVENLRMIIERNGLKGSVRCAVLNWAEGRLAEGFDLILCADCLFYTNSHEALLGCIHAHLQQGANLGSHMEGSLTLNFFPKIVQLATSFVFHFRVSFSDALQVAVLGLHMREKPQKGVGGVGEEEGFVTRLLEAVHFACMQISDEVVEEVQTERGVWLEFEGCVLAQVAHLVTDALCNTWPDDLLLFARHGKRSIVNVNDIKLLVRKNESLVKLMDEELGKMPSTRRQKSVSGLRSESSTAVDEEDSNEAKKLNNRASSVRRGRPPKKKTDSNRILNASRITDFLVNDSEPTAGPSTVTDNASLSGATDDEYSRGSMLSGEWVPLKRHSDAVTCTSLQGESSPVGGSDRIVYDDLSSPFGLTVNSDEKTLAGPSKEVVEVEHKVKNNEDEIDLRSTGEQRGKGAGAKRKALKGRGGACKRRAVESSTTTSALNEVARDDKIIASSRDVEELKQGDISLEKISSSVVDKTADTNESDVLKTENSKLERFVQKCGTEENVSVITQQGIYKSECKETSSGFNKTMLNSKPINDKMRMKGMESSSSNHLRTFPSMGLSEMRFSELISVETSTVSPISNDHLRREDIVKSGGSSRDIFASPSPVSCNVERFKGAINVDKVSKSDDIVNNSSTAHRTGPCRNLSETLQSQQSELMTVISRRSSASSKEDSMDSSTWDAIDFDAIDAAVISTSHRQEQTNGNVIMNQSGGVMLAERTTEQQLVSPSETNVSEKRTARVGHRFDGFSDFNFESDEDEDVRIDTMASSNLGKHAKDIEAKNVYKVCTEEATCKSETHRSGRGNDRRMGNSISLSKQVEQSNVVTTASERRHGELKNRISKEFSAFTFESDEEEGVEESMHATPSTSSEIPTITNSTRASSTAKNSALKSELIFLKRILSAHYFSIFNFESDEEEEGELLHGSRRHSAW